LAANAKPRKFCRVRHRFENSLMRRNCVTFAKPIVDTEHDRAICKSAAARVSCYLMAAVWKLSPMHIAVILAVSLSMIHVASAEEAWECTLTVNNRPVKHKLFIVAKRVLFEHGKNAFDVIYDDGDRLVAYILLAKRPRITNYLILDRKTGVMLSMDDNLAVNTAPFKPYELDPDVEREDCESTR